MEVAAVGAHLVESVVAVILEGEDDPTGRRAKGASERVDGAALELRQVLENRFRRDESWPYSPSRPG